MLHLGKKNTLVVVREVDFGFYLSDQIQNDVLLPRKWAPEGLAIDDELEVFIYLDHEERPIATTMTPKIYLDEFAYLRAKEVNHLGAFVDWGLEKDLFVPYKNQPKQFEEGKYYLIYLYLDKETERLAGTARTNNYLDQVEPFYKIGDRVSILIGDDTEIGKQVVVDNGFRGIVYASENFKSIKRGDKSIGYIKKVREDGKLDVSLEPIGVIRLEKNAQKLLEFIQKQGGTTHLNDKSNPEDIYELLEMSKKNFKAALGILYKLKKVALFDNRTELIG
jgi:uncharacterized protein